MIELGKEVERLRSESGPAMPTTSPETLRLEELHQELEDLRQTNKSKLLLSIRLCVCVCDSFSYL